MTLSTWTANFIVFMTVVVVLTAIIWNKEEEINRLRYQKVEFHFVKNCNVCGFPVSFNEAISPVRD